MYTYMFTASIGLYECSVSGYLTLNLTQYIFKYTDPFRAKFDVQSTKSALGLLGCLNWLSKRPTTHTGKDNRTLEDLDDVPVRSWDAGNRSVV